MGYRMEYGTGNNDACFRRIGNKNIKLWTVTVIAAVLLIVGLVYRDQMVDLLLPGDPVVTKRAIGVFVEGLKEGERATDAFAAFCKVIVDEAHIS